MKSKREVRIEKYFLKDGENVADDEFSMDILRKTKIFIKYNPLVLDEVKPAIFKIIEGSLYEKLSNFAGHNVTDLIEESKNSDDCAFIISVGDDAHTTNEISIDRILSYREFLEVYNIARTSGFYALKSWVECIKSYPLFFFELYTNLYMAENVATNPKLSESIESIIDMYVGSSGVNENLPTPIAFPVKTSAYTGPLKAINKCGKLVNVAMPSPIKLYSEYGIIEPDTDLEYKFEQLIIDSFIYTTDYKLLNTIASIVIDCDGCIDIYKAGQLGLAINSLSNRIGEDNDIEFISSIYSLLNIIPEVCYYVSAEFFIRSMENTGFENFISLHKELSFYITRICYMQISSYSMFSNDIKIKFPYEYMPIDALSLVFKSVYDADIVNPYSLLSIAGKYGIKPFKSLIGSSVVPYGEAICSIASSVIYGITPKPLNSSVVPEVICSIDISGNSEARKFYKILGDFCKNNYNVTKYMNEEQYIASIYNIEFIVNNCNNYIVNFTKLIDELSEMKATANRLSYNTSCIISYICICANAERFKRVAMSKHALNDVIEKRMLDINDHIYCMCVSNEDIDFIDKNDIITISTNKNRQKFNNVHKVFSMEAGKTKIVLYALSLKLNDQYFYGINVFACNDKVLHSKVVNNSNKATLEM